MFVERVGDDALAPLAPAGNFASVEPDEPAGRNRIVAVQADGPSSAMRVRLMVVESGWSVLRRRILADPTSREPALTRR